MHFILPSMWWHQVEGLMSFNVLINYWWSTAPRYTGSGMNLLYHALLCLRDKPEHERKAWQAVLNHYIFDDPKRQDSTCRNKPVVCWVSWTRCKPGS